MKHLERMFIGLLAGATLAMASNLTAQTTDARSVQVVRIKGDARHSSGKSGWQTLKVGTMLKAGDLIQTAANSYVDVVLGQVATRPSRVFVGDAVSYQAKTEQDVIRVHEDSVLGFDRLSVMRTGADEVTDTQLDLRAGKITGQVKKMSAASRYEIKIPNGVAGVRGTTYSISAAGVIQVWSGSVVVSWTGGDGKPMTQVINSGYQFDLRTLQLTRVVEQGPNMRAMSTGTREVTRDITTYYVSPRVPTSTPSTPPEEEPPQEF